jgi:hypothetical protein
MKLRVHLSILATLAFAGAAFGQSATPTAADPPGYGISSSFMVRYFSNLSAADSYINLTNDGSAVTSGSHGAPTQNICANVYTFDANEEMVSCCTCPITANGLKSLSVKNDLVSNTLTPGVPLAVVVKLVATSPVLTYASSAYTLTSGCDATLAPSEVHSNGQWDNDGHSTKTLLVNALHAWAATPHLNTASGAYQMTETEFSNASLGDTEITNITNQCFYIGQLGSGFGICKSCQVRGLGASQQ